MRYRRNPECIIATTPMLDSSVTHYITDLGYIYNSLITLALRLAR